MRRSPNEQALRRSLELGFSLRESASLIHCKAIVEYDNEFPWQPFHAHIPPGGIDSEGYVEEVWISERLVKHELNGEIYLIINPLPSSIYHGKAWIDRFEYTPQGETLFPSSEMIVKYQITEL